MDYQTLIGLEIHVGLDVENKLFCACSAEKNLPANRSVCSYCAAYPSVLPQFNYRVLPLAIRAASLLRCEIRIESAFDKKLYFYPDLPKGYQSTQYYKPFAEYGRLVYPTEEGEKCARIRKIHLEEDAAKLTVDGDFVKIDCNRAGTALLEIVTEPCFSREEEVINFLKILRTELIRQKITKGRMELGEFRVDVNLSMNGHTRTEVKNLNSFRGAERALKAERLRQIASIRKGEPSEDSVYGFSEKTNTLFFMRKKENAAEYRYFPDPDLNPVVLTENAIRRHSAGAEAVIANRIRELRTEGFTLQEAMDFTEEETYYEIYRNSPLPPSLKKVWLLQETQKLRNKYHITAKNLNSDNFTRLLSLLLYEKISQNICRKTLEEILRFGTDPVEFIARRNLFLVNDREQIVEIARKILEEKAIFRDRGKKISYYLGRVLAATGDRADARTVREILEELIC